MRIQKNPLEASGKEEAPEDAVTAKRETAQTEAAQGEDGEVSGQVMLWSTSYFAVPLITCGASACTKQVHCVCYKRMVETQ